LNVITSLKTGSISARSKRGSAGESVVSVEGVVERIAHLHRTLALSTVVVLFKAVIKPPLPFPDGYLPSARPV